jgi:hypothetical protein
MVACVPCAAAAVATPTVWSSLSAFIGLGATTYAAKKTLGKKRKKTTKKRSQKGGSVSLKKDMSKIYNKSIKCSKKCSKDTMRRRKRKRLSHSIKKKFDRLEGLSPKDKKELNKQRVKRNRCWSKCDKIKQNDIRLHKKKYSKEYREINKGKKKNCCKCVYVKSGKNLRKIRGPWGHCSYDMDNCCKDKKTIVKSKK